jgi:hypothetical protein
MQLGPASGEGARRRELRRRSGKKTGAPVRGPVRWWRRASSLAANGATAEELLVAARARMERCGALAVVEKKVQGLEVSCYRGREGEGATVEAKRQWPLMAMRPARS